jgi:crotonobetainyl-CoA:carnitine CoA-transferase CaiB-like acyl-CoA transferase
MTQAGPDSPLHGIRVVELGTSVACAFAGKWLAALGADVVKLEPPSGDPARRAGPWPRSGPDPEASGRFLYLNTCKRSVVVDPLHGPDVERLAALVSGAQLVLDGSGRSDPALRAALARAPGAAARVRLTPFGDTGPFADRPATAFTIAALAGWMWHVGGEGKPPLAQWGEQVERLAGLHALGASLAALWAGEGSRFELTLLECAATVVGHHTGRISQTGVENRRTRPRSLWRVYPTRDGWAGVSALQRNYARLADAMKLPQLADVSPFLDHASRPDEEERLTALVSHWFASHTRAEVTALGMNESVPLTGVASIPEVAASAQLAHRGFFVRSTHPRAGDLMFPGQLWYSDAHSWRSGAAPLLGEHTNDAFAPPEKAPSGSASVGSGSLAGLRVLDLGQIWAGPYASTLLADQGADVIKVESPSFWDPNRCAAPPPEDRQRDWWNTCAYFHEYSRNKRSLGVDLKHRRGREILGRLVQHADVVIENFRAGVLERLGIGWDWLRAQREDLILIRMAGFGQTGPEHHLPAYGPMIEQLSGLAHLTGWGDGEPHMAAGYAYGDPVAAAAAASAALAALLQRRRTGRGQQIDLAQRDVTTALIGEAFVEWSMTGDEPVQRGNAHPVHAPHGAYPCRGDDEWIALAVETDVQWEALRDLIGNPDWARDPQLARAAGRCARRAELDERIAAWTGDRSKTEIFESCATRGIPAAPVSKMSELLTNPQLAARDFYEPISHPAMGEWRIHGWEWRPQGAGRCLRRPAPDFGADNREILTQLLGLSDDEVAELIQAGVIASEPIGVPALPGQESPAKR